MNCEKSPFEMNSDNVSLPSALHLSSVPVFFSGSSVPRLVQFCMRLGFVHRDFVKIVDTDSDRGVWWRKERTDWSDTLCFIDLRRFYLDIFHLTISWFRQYFSSWRFFYTSSAFIASILYGFGTRQAPRRVWWALRKMERSNRIWLVKDFCLQTFRDLYFGIIVLVQ